MIGKCWLSGSVLFSFSLSVFFSFPLTNFASFVKQDNSKVLLLVELLQWGVFLGRDTLLCCFW